MERWIELWRALTISEKNRFLKFAQSPYHNPDQRMIRIASWLMEEGDRHVDREHIHHALFPEEPFHYARISNILSYFGNLIKDFLAYEQLSQQKEKLARYRIRGLQQKQLIHATEHELRVLSKKLSNRAEQDETELQLTSLLREEEDMLLLSQGERRLTKSLELHIQLEEQLYLLRMLKRSCQWLNRGRLLPDQPPSPTVDRFIRQLSAYSESEFSHPLISAYRSVMALFVSDRPEEAYSDLMKSLQEHEHQFGFTDQQLLTQYARNHCIRMSNAGNSEYLRLLFEVYQLMIDRELIFYNGSLSHGDVKNIVSLGIILNEFDWTTWFLEKHGQRIIKDHRKNALSYNYAHLEYGRGNYGKALNLLAQVEMEDVFYALGIRTIMLKCYFENRDAESLYDHMNAFSKWLTRNKHLPQSQVLAHKRLLKLIRMIHRYRVVPMGPTARRRLQSRIDQLIQEKGMSQGRWIRQQWNLLHAG